MAQTPSSSLTSYCSAEEFLKRCDVRTVAELLSDTNASVKPADVPDDEVLAAMLMDASGQIESMAAVGGRYSAEDMQALTGAGRNFLRMLVSHIAMGLLYLRRPDRKLPLPAMYQHALEWMERLRYGERIFPLDESSRAGRYRHDETTEAELEAMQLSTFVAQRQFGIRNSRFRPRGISQPSQD